MSCHACIAPWCLMLAIIAGLTSCRSPKRQVFDELGERKVPVNGLSLLKAAGEGDERVVRLLLEAGVFTGQRDPGGYTPLHRAIDRKHSGIALALIEGGADPGVASLEGVTPAALAVYRDQPLILERLLAKGARPEGTTPDGEELLPWAIRLGGVGTVRRLMDGGAEIHQEDREGNPMLHVAIAAGREDLALELIERGADCGALSGSGESTMVVALRAGWRQHLPDLVRRGADPNRADREGWPPFERAVDGDDPVLARELLGLGARPRGGGLDLSLRMAYERGDRGVCGTLLGLGANPSPAGAQCLVRRAAAEDRTGFLHLFLGFVPVPEGLLAENCRRGRTHVAALLLAHGANPNELRAPYLVTPLMSAIDRGSDALTLRLLDGGADPNVRGTGGQPALHRAVARGKAETVRRLLEHGADVESPFATPVRPEFLKLVRGRTLRWLLVNDTRVTPLMLAVDSGSLATARVLLEHGAAVDVWTRRHSIWPINLAAGHQDVRMMRLLLGQDPVVEERRVEISLGEQRLRVYSSSGEELFNTPVSTGRKGYATPTGTFAITNRHRDWTSTIYHSKMPYFQRLNCADFGFHQGNVPGYPASHGCIRVPAGKAAKLFALTRLGDRVSIVP